MSLPLADEGRLAWVQRQARMPAEEWVARYGHMLLTWGWDQFRYGDPELDAWVADVPRIYADGERLERLRQRYLTPAERAANDAYDPS